MLKTYIMHYTPLIERKEHMIHQLNNHNIKNYEFIESFDKEVLTDKDLHKFDLKKLKLSEISLFLKHIKTLKQICNSDDNYALIFEDDVILDVNFNDKIINYLSQAPDNFDIMFIGSGCDLHISKDRIINDVNIYLKDNWEGDGSCKCADSYIITKKCCLKIIDFFNENSTIIDLPIDWWFNFVFRKLEFIVYWCEPTIVIQGSQNGSFKRSIT